MSSLLRKLLLHAMKFLGLCLLNYILMSCYIEIGHDKGWPKAAYMYSHFHKIVVPISSLLTHDDVAPQQSYYNPQNEAFLHSRTSRAISQNETYRRNTPYPPLKNRPAYAGIHIL